MGRGFVSKSGAIQLGRHGRKQDEYFAVKPPASNLLLGCQGNQPGPASPPLQRGGQIKRECGPRPALPGRSRPTSRSWNLTATGTGQASHNSSAVTSARLLFHFLVRFLGDRNAAEDVFRETFLQVHQSAKLFDPQRRFKPWLFTIAANKARDLIASQAPAAKPVPVQAPMNPGDQESGQYIDLMEAIPTRPWESMEKQELKKAVYDTVMSMPEHLREILLLSYFHQFPYRQISEILTIPLGTVKSRLHAAVASFALRWRAVEANKHTHP